MWRAVESGFDKKESLYLQFQLFPNEFHPSEAQIEIQRGRIGPIRFGATPTSYPHLCQTLAALTVRPAENLPDTETQD